MDKKSLSYRWSMAVKGWSVKGEFAQDRMEDVLDYVKLLKKEISFLRNVNSLVGKI
jgi:hypothetical protein